MLAVGCEPHVRQAPEFLMQGSEAAGKGGGGGGVLSSHPHLVEARFESFRVLTLLHDR